MPARRAAKKKSRDKKEPLRGVALVENAIAKIDSKGAGLSGCGLAAHAPSGLPPEVIASLRLSNGAALPPSLARFLSYDATYLGLIGDPQAPAFRGLKFREMMLREFDEQTASAYDFSDMLPGDCYVVPGGSDSRHFMYVGKLN